MASKVVLLLSKFFDANYKPDTIGGEADKLIKSVGGRYLTIDEGVKKPIPVWNSSVLELPQIREEPKRTLEEDVLDMSFEEEVAKELGERIDDPRFEAEERLRDDNKSLRDLEKIIKKLAECYDKIWIEMEKKGLPCLVDFEFYIPSSQ